MKNLIYLIFSTFFILPFHAYSNESFSVEIQALTLIMKEYKNNNSGINDTKLISPNYMAYKQDECNAKVEVTDNSGLQIKTMQSFNVNVCKKEINRTLNN
tara:strand:+ start:1089 stop:1388 length:300 start_codon:yes stop_codon:yes gene_type:complete